MILNASDTSLYDNSGTLPNMGSAILDYFQRLQLSRITKSVDNFEVQEVVTPLLLYGVVQPFSARMLTMKPEGQRSWRWFTLHCDPSTRLEIDDQVWIKNFLYRVLQILDYTDYGYLEYHLIQDYQNTDKAPVFPNQDNLSKFEGNITVVAAFLDVVVSATIPDARNAIWKLYDSTGAPVIAAITVLNATTVRITTVPGTYRLIGAQ